MQVQSAAVAHSMARGLAEKHGCHRGTMDAVKTCLKQLPFHELTYPHGDENTTLTDLPGAYWVAPSFPWSMTVLAIIYLLG